jgi:hypothetical protein
MVRKIACFFTGGFTESGAMQYFLEKMGDNLKINQFCPNKAMKRRGTNGKPHMIKSVNGLTGTSLIHYVYDYIDKYGDDLNEYDAILIEDDMDDRFYEYIVAGDETTKRKCRNYEYMQYCNEIRNTIRAKLNKDGNFPVFLLFASPEIETWFLADWDNSFGKVYGPKGVNILSSVANSYFSYSFNKYVHKNILKQYEDNMEAYGYFNGEYIKLSTQIQEALSGEYKVWIDREGDSYGLSKCESLIYSKSIHGDKMLRNISPKQVGNKCLMFYRETYDEIQKFITE